MLLRKGIKVWLFLFLCCLQLYNSEILFSDEDKQGVSILFLFSILLVVVNRKLYIAKSALENERNELKRKVLERTKVLSQLHDQAKQQALSDSLTGLSNRRDFFEKGRIIHNQNQRQDGLYSIMKLDLDYFKKTNDQFGHAAGDRGLVAVAGEFRSLIRTTDVAARIGGEEFAAILSAMSIEMLYPIAERIRPFIGLYQRELSSKRLFFFMIELDSIISNKYNFLV